MTKIYLVSNCFGDPNKIYIGKTKNSRKKDHRITFGKQIVYEYIDEINSLKSKDWAPLETFWIQHFKDYGYELMNKNNGGCGMGFCTQETKDKISKSLKGRKNTWTKKGMGLGRKYSQETIEKMKGRKYSQETIEKMKGRKYSENSKIKMRKPRIKKWIKDKIVSLEIVIEIRRKYETGNFTRSSLSREYNVSWGTIKNITDKINSYKDI